MASRVRARRPLEPTVRRRPAGWGTAFVKIAALDYTADWPATSAACTKRWTDTRSFPVASMGRRRPRAHARRRGPDQRDLAAALGRRSRRGGTGGPRRRARDLASPGTPSAVERQFGLDGWPDVVADPQPFLALGICSAAWLEEHLPTLADSSASAEIAGDSFLHLGEERQPVPAAANEPCSWTGTTPPWATPDTARMAVARAEGGPAPHEILPEETPGLPQIGSLLAGYFSARAGLSPIPQAPHARPLQLAQSRTSLPWAARLLGLPPPPRGRRPLHLQHTATMPVWTPPTPT